jgi:FkbM family methyltransferase
MTVINRLVTAYSSLPHHPGKGILVNRLLAMTPIDAGSPRLCRRMGVRFECDLNDHVGRHIYYSIFERRDALRLSRIVKPGHTIVDAGANIGYYSLLFAKWLKGAGSVHAFEPFPSTAQSFIRNLQLNPDLQGTVQLHQIALSNHSGTVSMDVPDSANCGCNYISTSSPGMIRAVKLDDFVAEHGIERLDLLKIDIEGAEVSLLQGAELTLKRLRPVIMIEINPSALRRFGQTAADVVSILGLHRYRLTLTTRWGGLRPLSALPTRGEPNVFAFPID